MLIYKHPWVYHNSVRALGELLSKLPRHDTHQVSVRNGIPVVEQDHILDEVNPDDSGLNEAGPEGRLVGDGHLLREV